MNLRFLLNCFRPRPPMPERAVNRDTNRERALRVLVARGRITIRDINRFSNEGSKLIHQLRQGGYLHPLGMGETWVDNASGKGRHKVFAWTEKLPPKWVRSDAYVGADRRKTPRGTK